MAHGIKEKPKHEPQLALNGATFSPIYDEIRDISNAIDMLCFHKMGEKTKERYDKVQELAGQLQEAAHELHEHLAWDKLEC